MAKERSAPTVPVPTAEQKRIAAENADRARQVIQTGNFDYGISLLMTCCKIDPTSVAYRHALRKAQKEKYKNNLRGSGLAFLTVPGKKRKMKMAKSSRDYLKVLEYGEEVLTKCPWDLGTQMDMAEAFDALGLIDLAVFSLDQARQKFPKDATLNRALARMFEKRGDFKAAMVLWTLIKEANPRDLEAAHKAKDLAASETIKQGGYEDVARGSKVSPALGGSKDQTSQSGTTPVDKLAREAGPLLKRLEADPTEPTLYTQLTALYRRYGETDRARAVLQQGLGPTGNHFSLQLELQELDLAPIRKSLEQVDAKLKKLRARQPSEDDDDEGPSEEELTKQRTKLVKEVIAREAEIMRVKADRFPNDLTHRLELGMRLLKLDQVDEAVSELQQARRDEKLKGRAALYLGLGFKRKKNWKLAERNLDDALQALPAADEANRKEAMYHLATGCAEAGDYGRATEVGHELANLDYNYKNIGKLLDDWHKKAG